MHYRWSKVWAVQVPADDTTQPGEVIAVQSNGGESKQLVVSVTEMSSRTGKPYKVLLTRESE